jgi:rare lipoprotein A
MGSRSTRRAVVMALNGRAVAGAIAAVLALAAGLSGCATRRPPSTAPGRGSTTVLEVREGLASYYGSGFQGKTTASGVRFDMNALIAAHPSYPFGTRIRVTNLGNGRSVTVTVLDRGPAQRLQSEGVIVDLSREAAARLGFIREGRARIRVEVLEFGEP